MSDISFSKLADLSSPILARTCAMGKSPRQAGHVADTAESTGYQILFSVIFGPDPITATKRRGHPMPSTVISRIAATALFAIGATAAAAVSDKPPRFLTVPALGLRLPLERINLEPFPEDIRLKCGQRYDEAFFTSRVWIFGQARNAGATYYVLGGYSKRLHKEPGQKLYEYWG